jgi:hypothetical protein
MVRFLCAVTVVLGALAALAEISSFIMDRGGIIRDLMRPRQIAMRPPLVDAAQPGCTGDNPIVEMLCKDRRDGTILVGN